jgi:hypothetical protein
MNVATLESVFAVDTFGADAIDRDSENIPARDASSVSRYAPPLNARI